MISDDDIRRLRAIATAADKGGRPWFWHASEREGGAGYPQTVMREGDVGIICTTYDEPDLPAITPEFIAAFDPPTVLALLDLAEAARA